MNKRGLKTLREVHKVFSRGKLTLSLAESCTGGLISHFITLLPGASSFFKAGAVTYSAAAKQTILKIPKKTLLAHGVISEETARIMAEKVRDLLDSDYGLSTTGNLGPDVLEGKPKGLIYIAVSCRGKTDVNKLTLRGQRETVKEKASLTALEFLLSTVKKRDRDK